MNGYGIPQPTYQRGSISEEFVRTVFGESRPDLRDIAANAGVQRIQAARDRIIRRLTIGTGVASTPSLISCNTEEERRLVQATVTAVAALTRELCRDLNREVLSEEDGSQIQHTDIVVGG